MIRVRQIKAKIHDNKEDIIKNIARKLKINENEINDIIIKKQSLDSRNKQDIHYVYECDVKLKSETKVLRRKSNDIFPSPIEEYKFDITGTKTLNKRPIIIGSGPAGLFCAYMLAKYGYKPIIMERGEKIEDRVKTVEHFWQTGEGGSRYFFRWKVKYNGKR